MEDWKCLLYFGNSQKICHRIGTRPTISCCNWKTCRWTSSQKTWGGIMGILEKTRQCCQNPSIFLILFDGGDTPDLPIRICRGCSQKPLFQKFIKSKQNISQHSKIQRRCKWKSFWCGRFAKTLPQTALIRIVLLSRYYSN